MRFAHVLFAGALTTVVTGAGAARANPLFPGFVQQFTGSASPPPCTICHQTLAGGSGTATKPFALYLKSRGLVDPKKDTLTNALKAAQGEMHKTNGNPLTDIDALKQGLDPNEPAGAAPIPPPDFGCGAHVAPRTGPAKAVPLLLAALVLGAARRRKAARATSA